MTPPSVNVVLFLAEDEVYQMLGRRISIAMYACLKAGIASFAG